MVLQFSSYSTFWSVYIGKSLCNLLSVFHLIIEEFMFCFLREMRNFEEEQLQKECLLQQKRNKLQECKNNLLEVMSKAVKLNDEAEKDRESISKLRYKLVNI